MTEISVIQNPPKIAPNRNRIILAGGSGFLGRALADHFTRAQWEVVTFTRQPSAKSNSERFVTWDATGMGSWHAELEGTAAVINLTGRSVDCRYHAHNRKEILESRVNSTRVLGAAIAQCTDPPQVWLNASTATIYKHTFGDPWDEQGQTGATPEAKDAFSIDVAEAWERAFAQATTPHTRKVTLRMAMVLGHTRNSVFPVLRHLVRLGLGGRMGDGRQFVSWIHQSDYCRAIEWLIMHDDLEGVINVAAPNPLSNREMMSTLREVCNMRFGLPAAKWMLELGAFFLRTETELIIKSRRVVPARMLASGFQFRFPTIRKAFEDLGPTAATSVPA